jgi:hypothetical protein
MNTKTSPEEVTHKVSPPGHPLKENAPYDKRELRERIAERQGILEAELERLSKLTPIPTSHPQVDTIAASLAALKTMLPAAGDTISEVSAAELSRWLVDAPFVLDEKARHKRHEAR